ncbi:protease inhibitor I9 family protein [Oceanobacillus iheyensis]|uniref:protease inhibitor I9 family protein n=1 Tax=Oceanobacillus iheyensis TaxID=182710 RepID=UPI003642226A
MNRGKFSKVALCIVLLFGAVAPIGTQSIGHAQPQSSAGDILSNLSQEQREALDNLEANRSLRGLQLSRDIDLKSDEAVTVIVEFDQLPAKAEQFQKSLEGEKTSLDTLEKKVEESHKKFKKDIDTNIKKKAKSTDDPYEIKYEYKTALNGVAITLAANEIETLLESDVVKAVYNEHEVQLSPPPKTNEEEGSTTKVESIPFLNIDKLHEEGITGAGFAPSQLKYGEWLKIENTGDMDAFLKATYNQSLSADVPLNAYKVGYIAYKFSEGEEMTEDILEESRIYLDKLFNGTTNEVTSHKIASGVEMIVGFVEDEEAQAAAKSSNKKAKMVLGDGSKEGEKHEFWQLNDDQYIDLSFAIKLDEKAGNEYQGVTYSSNLNVIAKQTDDGAKY